MKKINLDLIRIILSGLLFVINLFLSDFTLKIILICISYIIISSEMYINLFKNIRKLEIFDENFLMIIATITAFIIGEYEEAILVMWLFNLGEYLSDKAVSQSEESITKLMDLRGDTINLKQADNIINTDIKNVKIGDIFIVKPGEKIGLDGMVVDGISNVDTASITGESVPKKIRSGDMVISGYTNIDSILTIKATSNFETSTASKIIELIKNAEDKKTKTEKFITRFCKIYTPIIVLLAILLTLIPYLMTGDLNKWLYRSLIFLVTSCPCALIISIPLGSFSGIGDASKRGILVKGSVELESLSKIKNIIFDKTGTLTKGVFEVQTINSITNNQSELLEIAAYGEYYSNHPIAKSIINKYNKEIIPEKISNFKEISGKGVSVYVDDAYVLIGNYEFMQENNIDIKKENSVGTVIYIAIDKNYKGNIVIADEIKKETTDFIKKLKESGISNLAIVSGDNEKIVKYVSQKIGIDEYYYSMLPNDKVLKVNEYKEKDFTAFVGDGMNDAPVMKTSDLGIAMGGIGSDATIEAADVVIMTDNLLKINEAISISKKTLSIVKFNIIFSLLIKFLMLILGALGISKIWMAVFADVGVTLLLVLNSLKLVIKK